MRLNVSPRCTLAAQPVLWVFSQQLRLKRGKKSLFSSQLSFSFTSDFSGSWTHQSTDLFHLGAEPFSIFLLVPLDSPLHVRRAGVLSAGSERRLSGRHFINEAAEAPPVSADAVVLMADHLRSWNHRLV